VINLLTNHRHSREGTSFPTPIGNLVDIGAMLGKIPACAGMTVAFFENESLLLSTGITPFD
jgi:hypothetical protein